MVPLKSVLAALFAVLMIAGCATVGRQSPAPNIYVMRHLNTPAGVKDPDLTTEGQRIADELVAWFDRDRPDVIYVTDTKRARQTAAPLARRLGVTPRIYDPADNPRLIAAVLNEAGTVLIVGHSNTVPAIVEGLGGPRPAPLVHEDFGDIWHIAGPARITTQAMIGH